MSTSRTRKQPVPPRPAVREPLPTYSVVVDTNVLIDILNRERGQGSMRSLRPAQRTVRLTAARVESAA